MKKKFPFCSDIPTRPLDWKQYFFKGGLMQSPLSILIDHVLVIYATKTCLKKNKLHVS